jgi:hypothetical protein
MNDEVLVLTNFSQAFTYENTFMDRLVSQSNSSPVNKVINFAIENPAILAPISMGLSSAVANADSVLYRAMNKEKVANTDRQIFLMHLCALNEFPYKKLNWAKCIRINHYLSWFLPIFKDRLDALQKLREMDATDYEISSRATLYESAMRELDYLHNKICQIIDSYQTKSSAEYNTYIENIPNQESSLKTAVEGIDKEIQKNDLQFKSILIDELTYKAKNSKFTDDRNEIVSTYYCHAYDCKNFATIDSKYCFDHKCKEPGCNYKTRDTCDEMMNTVAISAIKAVVAVAGNVNNDHFVDIGNRFCDYHNADLGLDSMEWSESHFNHEAGDYEFKKEELPPSLGVRLLQLLGIIFAVIVVIIGFSSLNPQNTSSSEPAAEAPPAADTPAADAMPPADDASATEAMPPDAAPAVDDAPAAKATPPAEPSPEATVPAPAALSTTQAELEADSQNNMGKCPAVPDDVMAQVYDNYVDLCADTNHPTLDVGPVCNVKDWGLAQQGWLNSIKKLVNVNVVDDLCKQACKSRQPVPLHQFETKICRS